MNTDVWDMVIESFELRGAGRVFTGRLFSDPFDVSDFERGFVIVDDDLLTDGETSGSLAKILVSVGECRFRIWIRQPVVVRDGG